MKKWFSHAKKSAQDREGYEESEYDLDGMGDKQQNYQAEEDEEQPPYYYEQDEENEELFDGGLEEEESSLMDEPEEGEAAEGYYREPEEGCMEEEEIEAAGGYYFASEEGYIGEEEGEATEGYHREPEEGCMEEEEIETAEGYYCELEEGYIGEEEGEATEGYYCEPEEGCMEEEEIEAAESYNCEPEEGYFEEEEETSVDYLEEPAWGYEPETLYEETLEELPSSYYEPEDAYQELEEGEATQGYYCEPEDAYGELEEGEATQSYYHESEGGYMDEEEIDPCACDYHEPEYDYRQEPEQRKVCCQEPDDFYGDGREEELLQFSAYEGVQPEEYGDETEEGGELPKAEADWEEYAWYCEAESGEYEEAPYQEGVAAYEEDAACIEPPVKNRDRRREAPAKRKEDAGGMELMDKIMIVAGVAVLILAAVTVSVFVKARIVQNQVLDFANVGLQLNGINVIGEKGIMAVANARIAKMAEATPAPTDTPEPPEPDKDYNETTYNREISVAPDFTSIQQDLKIKFINRHSDKLVPNVPFSVIVTGPDGKNYIWSDDDMDGIIYKKDIEPGTYQVAMETLADSKYSDYGISTSPQTVEVKKEITYQKVDVANEVKQETEVNAAKEDTKKNDTIVESSLKDTVDWVDSKVMAVAYIPVEKNTIPDPAKSAGRLGDVPVHMLAEIYTEPPGSGPDQTPSPAKGTITVEQGTLTGGMMTTLSTKASVSGFAEGRTVLYSVQTDNPAVATASVDYSGNINVFTVAAGKAVITVTANYEGGMQDTEASAMIEVTVDMGFSMSLDTNALTTFVNSSAVFHASLSGHVTQDPAVTAESSDPGIASVSVDGLTVTVRGIAEGDAVITVRYEENGGEISSVCHVSVRKNGAQESKELLKDANGRQLYVKSGNSYREAVYADYYTEENFFVKEEARYTGWQTIEGKTYYFTAEGIKVTGEQVIQGAKYNFAEDGSLMTGDGVMGIDVSKWNGTIDWNAVKNSGVSYAIIRCGYRGSSAGKLIQDPQFEANIKGATEAGLKVGVYFFSQAVNEIEAVEEASMALEQIKGYQLSYPVFIDVEASGGRGDALDTAARTAVCKAFCTTIQNAGYTAGVYSNKLWMEGKIDMGSLNAYKVWLAQYAAAPTYGGKYDLWQYKADGSISGIKGNVDLNISYLGN